MGDYGKYIVYYCKNIKPKKIHKDLATCPISTPMLKKIILQMERDIRKHFRRRRGKE